MKRLLLPLFLISPAVGGAESAEAKRPSFRIPPQVAVDGEEITLGEIAEFSVPDRSSADGEQALRSISLGPAPAPGRKSQLLGENVLATIRSRGFNLESFGYALPPSISVLRRGREIAPEEILGVLRESGDGDSSLEFRDVTFERAPVIPVGPTEVAVERLGPPAGGRIPLRVEVSVAGRVAARFLATALADDWRDIPVLTQEIERGMLINPSDLTTATVNRAHYPVDIVSDLEEVVGRRAKRRLPAGEAIRRGTIDLPPTVQKGKQIKVRYARGALTASVLATAVEDAFLGEEIRVRNESSKKILMGRVVSAEEIELRGGGS